ncbi:MAG: hypothetical protein KAY32_01910 [Candidatus Eisenbacteria sp.]|nr:hypothetical protein [Candidatus Eisenbacteria bacterium]
MEQHAVAGLEEKSDVKITMHAPDIDRNRPVAAIKWGDGTVIDTVYKVNCADG